MSEMISVGRISFYPTKILGTGTTSTVFLGNFSGREVAVKKIPKLQVKPCRTEIDLLLKLDEQKNIVKYFIDEVICKDFQRIFFNLLRILGGRIFFLHCSNKV